MTDMDEETHDEGTRLSALGQLKERREQIFTKQVLTLPVPRWEDPVIKVRYRPVPHDLIRNAQRRVERTKKNAQAKEELYGNMDLLIKSCVGVVAVIDGQEYSLWPNEPKGELTTFDADLAENLGLPNGATARQVVQALFITDGDILSQAQELVEWSGYRETEADDELEGE